MDGVGKGKRCWIIVKIMGVDIFLSNLIEIYMTSSLVHLTKLITSYNYPVSVCISVQIM